jgi:hypothetical protein
MTRTFAALMLLVAAASPLRAASPQIFPDDYKPTTCEVKNVCVSYDRSEITSSGARMQGYTNMREEWISAHWDKLLSDIKPYCAKLATCYATAGNTSMFCNDVVLTQMMSVCDQYPEKSDDRDQCFLFLRTYANGIDLKAWKTWEEAQACARANAAAGAPPRQMEIIMTPKTLPPDFNGKLIIYALDKETRVPLKASITVEGETLYSRDVPDGSPTTSYPLPWKAKLQRVEREVVAPNVTISRAGYESVTFRMPIEVRSMIVTMTPSLARLKRGRNTVTITAKDSVTGQPVDARVLIAQRDFGEANTPFELELKRGEKPAEIRVRSSFDRYNDVVVPSAP